MRTERKTDTSEGGATQGAEDAKKPDAPRPGEAAKVSETDAKPEETVGPASELKW